jgi:hypothetical protein
MRTIKCIWIFLIAILFQQCNKKSPETPAPTPPAVSITAKEVDGKDFAGTTRYDISVNPSIRFSFSAPLSKALVANSVLIKNSAGVQVPFTISFADNDSTVIIQPSSLLNYISRYLVTVLSTLRSAAGGAFTGPDTTHFVTKIDSSRKFPIISDNALLDLAQQQTFKFFWDFGHPVSGLARERNNGDNNIVTSGGSGFGIMAILVGIERSFITRSQGLARIKMIASFLKSTAQTFHGAYPHWLNGSTGAVIPFSTKDNGADLVETSYLMQGLLCARQYFSGAGADESVLRDDINFIYQRVEWNWFRQNNQNVLYWHWSPTHNWEMNMPIKGWNECLITYVIAASSPTFSIPSIVYTNGWAGGPGFINGANYFGHVLPLGPPMGGPLFFSHYSFLGINPNGLSDTYADYSVQTKNHTRINYEYCISNPKGYFGYGDSVWGLTSSDGPNGYVASSPTNDLGVIAPTAAISSMPYTPDESLAALKFFYYVLGDKIWKQYGFVDAFSLKDPWFADSFLAIDQGPIIVMIENYRTGLLWNLFTSCPEIKTGMTSLNFSSPYL